MLRLLGGWHPVAPATRWRGSTALLDLLLPTLVPPPVRRQPWMLRVLDPAAAVAARGWAADVDVSFVLVDPQRGDTAHRLVVEGGQGRLEPADPTGPRLHVRGLALLLAGAAGTARVRALGLLDGDLPGLDPACAGPVPDLLDYF